MAERTPRAAPSPSEPGAILALRVPVFAALIGLTSLAILLQGVFAGVFIEPGAHSGWLDAHDINADVAGALAIGTAIYAVGWLRAAAPSLAIGSTVLAVLVIALAAIGHAIVGSHDDGLTPVHVPLALLAFGLTIWLSVKARTLRKAASA